MGIGAGLSSIVVSYCRLLASISLLSLLIFCSHLNYLRFTSQKAKLGTRPEAECKFSRCATRTNS
jgi:hypothetical protein